MSSCIYETIDEINAEQIKQHDYLKTSQQDLKICNSVVTSINEEETKWIKLIEDTTKNLLSDVQIKIKKCSSVKEKSEEMSQLLGDIRESLNSLCKEKFQLVVLSKWTQIIRSIMDYQKLQLDEVTAQVDGWKMEIIQTPSHIHQLFRSRIIHCEGTPADSIDILTTKVNSLKIEGESTPLSASTRLCEEVTGINVGNSTFYCQELNEWEQGSDIKPEIQSLLEENERKVNFKKKQDSDAAEIAGLQVQRQQHKDQIKALEMSIAY